jgi:hypothetical protein
MNRRVSGEDLSFTLYPFPFAPCSYNVLEGEHVFILPSDSEMRFTYSPAPSMVRTPKSDPLLIFNELLGVDVEQY